MYPSRAVRQMHRPLFSVLLLLTCCVLAAQNKNIDSHMEYCSDSWRLGR